MRDDDEGRQGTECAMRGKWTVRGRRVGKDE